MLTFFMKKMLGHFQFAKLDTPTFSIEPKNLRILMRRFLLLTSTLLIEITDFQAGDGSFQSYFRPDLVNDGVF